MCVKDEGEYFFRNILGYVSLPALYLYRTCACFPGTGALPQKYVSILCLCVLKMKKQKKNTFNIDDERA